MGVVPSMLRARGYNEVRVEAPVAPFRVREIDHRPVAEPGAAPEVEDVLGGVGPERGVWRDVEIEGGTASLPVGR
jgi:hypothetical protein